MPEAADIAAILRFTLHRLEQLGVRQVVLFTGHFADEQPAMIAGLARDWTSGCSAMRVLALGVNGTAGAPLPPGHAGRFETTLRAACHPETVDLSLLPAAGPQEAGGDPCGPQRHDPRPTACPQPARRLQGRPPPRDFPAKDAPALRRVMARWLADQAGAI